MKIAKTILLVEDDEDDQELFLLALEGIKNAVLYGIANNGKEAMERLLGATVLPDLVFSDINMPLMNGMEYLSAMVRNPQTRDIPVVILSTGTYLEELFIKVGAKVCISKPDNELTLRAYLEQVLLMDLQPSSNPAT